MSPKYKEKTFLPKPKKNALKSKTFRAMLFSLASMLICLSLLVGSTFAWFTDTVSSHRNTLTAGNLDIALYQGVVADGTITYPIEVTDETMLFTDGAVWLPGDTEVAYLKLENVGNLFLRYTLTVEVTDETIGRNVNNETVSLSSLLQFDIVELTENQYFTTNAAAVDAAKNAAVLRTSPYTGVLSADGDGDTRYLAVVVSMPSTTENEANFQGTPSSVKVGISLSATQNSQESDSFDSNYDEAATYPTT